MRRGSSGHGSLAHRVRSYGVAETNHYSRKRLMFRPLCPSTQPHSGGGGGGILFRLSLIVEGLPGESGAFKDATGCRNGCHAVRRADSLLAALSLVLIPPESNLVCHRGCSLTLHFYCAPTRPVNMQTILNKIACGMSELRQFMRRRVLTNFGVNSMAAENRRGAVNEKVLRLAHPTLYHCTHWVSLTTIMWRCT